MNKQAQEKENMRNFFQNIINTQRTFKTAYIRDLKTLIAKDLDLAQNKLTVEISTIASTWTEEWNLEHTYWGFERAEYFFV